MEQNFDHVLRAIALIIQQKKNYELVEQYSQVDITIFLFFWLLDGT